MSQVTWRASDQLIEQVKSVAAEQNSSMNDYLTRVLTAVVDPDFAGDDAQRTRERLRRAGVLAASGRARPRPNIEAVAAARREAGSGETLADLVADGRR